MGRATLSSQNIKRRARTRAARGRATEQLALPPTEKLTHEELDDLVADAITRGLKITKVEEDKKRPQFAAPKYHKKLRHAGIGYNGGGRN